MRYIPPSFQEVKAVPQALLGPMFFALDSTQGDYNSVLNALPSYNIMGDHVDNANLKIITAYVDDDYLDKTAALSDLRRSTYPNILCRHCWENLNEFSTTGWHTLGKSEESTEGAAGRVVKNYTQTASGAGDGSTLYDADDYAAAGTIAAGTTAVVHGKIWASRTSALNSRTTEWLEQGGGQTEADACTVRNDAGRSPGIFIDGQEIWAGHWSTDLPWRHVPDLASEGCYIKGNMGQDGSVVINAPNVVIDHDRVDPSQSVQDIDKALLTKVSTIGELTEENTFYNARTGQGAFSASDGYGSFAAVIQDDGGSYTDLTTEAGDATEADVPFYPTVVAADDAIYFGLPKLWNLLLFSRGGTGQVGAGTYTLGYEYHNGSAWVSLADFGFRSADDLHFKDVDGSGFGRFYFNPPNDWTPVSVNGQGPYYYIRARYISGTMTTVPTFTQLFVGAIFDIVHTSDGVEPGLCTHGWGLGHFIGFRLPTRVGYARFVNVNMLGSDGFLGGLAGDDYAPAIFKIEGGRYMHGYTGYLNGSMTEFHIKEAVDRTPPWPAASDLPNSTNNYGIQRLIQRWGTDPAKFHPDVIPRFAHFYYLTVGPHTTTTVGGGSSPGFPAYWLYDGVIFQHVGVNGPGYTRTSNPDMHTFASRTFYTPANGCFIKRMMSLDGHAHVYLYATADTNNRSPIDANVQNMGPMVFEDCLIQGTGPQTPTAGLNGLRFGGGSGSGNVQDDYSLSNWRDITLRRVALMDLAGSGSIDDSTAILWHYDTNSLKLEGVSVINCQRGIGVGGGEGNAALYTVVEENGVEFTDHTADAYNSNTFDAMPAGAGPDDAIYFAVMRWPWRGLLTNIITSGVGSGLAGVWEYSTSSGDTWSAIPTSGSWSDGIADFTAGTGFQNLNYDKMTDWVATNKGGDLPVVAYWIRFRITAGTYTTTPQIARTVADDQMGGYLEMDLGDQIEFLDMDSWFGETHLNAGHSTDGRTFKVDKITGRLKPGQTIATAPIAFQSSAGTDARFTLAQVKAGTPAFVKDYAMSQAKVDLSSMCENVSETPGVDIEEVPA